MPSFPNMRLSADNLTCKRGGKKIFTGLSFAVRAGEALVLAGPNGSGKTSLLRVIAGYIQPTNGAVAVEGAEDPEAGIGEMCHFVGHLNGVKSHFTVRENLHFWAGYLDTQYLDGDSQGNGEKRGSADKLIGEALQGFALTGLDDIPAGYLSAGQRRRLCLARLLVAKRPIWLLDEPTVSLDAKSQSLVAKAVNDHLAGGGMVIAATHIELGLDNARELALGRVGGQG